MIYSKVIKSFDAQIENLFIKIEKAFSFVCVCSLLVVLITTIIYNVVNAIFYENLLILVLSFYLFITGCTLWYLGIYQGILILSRKFFLAKEIFIRVTSRYGFKKGVSSLIRLFEKRFNNFRSISQKNSLHPDKLQSNKNQKKESFTNAKKPGPNTPPELIEDLEKLINDLPKGFFHDNGKIKHTSVAKFALDPQKAEWFANKWDYSRKQIGNLVKKIKKREQFMEK